MLPSRAAWTTAGQLGGEARVEVGVEDVASSSSPSIRFVTVLPFGDQHLALCTASPRARSRPRRRRRRSWSSPRGSRRPSRRRSAWPASSRRTFALYGIGQLGRQHRVEQEPLDVVGCASAYAMRQLRAVRDAVERDLVDAERLRGPRRGPRRARRCCRSRAVGPIVAAQAAAAARCWSARDRGWRAGQSSKPGLAGAAVVVGDERVAGEEVAVELTGCSVVRARRRAPSPGRGRRRSGRSCPAACPAAGTSSTCSEIVPGTRPVRSSGTTTAEQMRPGVVPHCDAAASPRSAARRAARGQRRGEARSPDPRLAGRPDAPAVPKARAPRASRRRPAAENARPSTETDPRQGT